MPAGAHCEALVGKMHALPAQQPAHVAGSHTQVPPVQRCPGPQGPPVPQPHRPASHTLLLGPQATHALPAVPHWVSICDDGWQNPPAQQPEGQLPRPQPVQTPASHVDGAVHAWQLPPVRPQAVFEVPARQPPSAPQQPVHVAGLQTQRPIWHRSPGPQGLFGPHLQSPSALQVSAVTASHGLQLSPIVPHAESPAAWQPPSAPQHPEPQLRGPHTQRPATHSRPEGHAPASPQLQAPPAQRSVR
jgi:hypothetical protein